VRRVGGLADSVTDTDLLSLAEDRATGIVFDRMDATDYAHALRRALALYQRRNDWLQVQRAGMRQSFSWASAARHYADLYRSLIVSH
jgi:starch synthase